MSRLVRRQAAGSPTTPGIHSERNSLSNWFAVGDRSLDKFINFKKWLLRSPGPIRLSTSKRKLPRKMADELGPIFLTAQPLDPTRR